MKNKSVMFRMTGRSADKRSDAISNRFCGAVCNIHIAHIVHMRARAHMNPVNIVSSFGLCASR